MKAATIIGWAGVVAAIVALYARCAVQAEARRALESLEACVSMYEADARAADECLEVLARCIETPVLLTVEGENRAE